MMGDWAWWGPGILFMAFCMVMMMWMMGGHGSHASGSAGGSDSGGSHGQKSGGAEQILAERLARGEIDTDEYERRVTALRGSRDPDRAPEVRHDS